MKKYIEISADVNDGEYVRKRTEISDEDLAIIAPVISAIKAYDADESVKGYKYNWWDNGRSRKTVSTPRKLYVDSGKCTQEAFDIFSEMIPYSEEGVHTIAEIVLLVVQEEQKLL